MTNHEPVFPGLIAQRAHDHPDRVFMQDVRGGQLTYDELNAGGAAWAAAYHRYGVQAGDRVVTMMSARFEFYESWLGLSWLHAIDTPLNNDYRGAMLTHALNNSGAAVAVVEARFLQRFEAVVDELITPPTIVVLDPDMKEDQAPSYDTTSVDEFLAGAPPLPALTSPAPWDVATIVYTSGTTGPSKGVMMPWRQLYHLATDAFPTEDFTEADAFYLPVVTYHMGAKAMPYLMALVNGRVVVRDRFSATDFLSDIQAYACTITVMVAAIAELMSAAAPSATDADTPLKYALMAPVTADVDGFSARFGVKVGTAYGMTELAPVIGSNGWDVNNANSTSCGRLKPGFEVRIVDEHDIEVPTGEIGELIVRADQPWTLNAGYLGMPDATAAAWRNGWFHTGDAFRCDDAGNFFFLDRMKDAIRRRGENISSFEVEAVVASHPEIAEVAAIAVPADLNEDEVKVVVVRTPDSSLTAEQLIEYLIPITPRFMIPRYVEFVDELPKTPTSKVQKAKLREDGVTPQTWDRDQAGISIPA